MGDERERVDREKGSGTAFRKRLKPDHDADLREKRAFVEMTLAYSAGKFDWRWSEIAPDVVGTLTGDRRDDFFEDCKVRFDGENGSRHRFRHAGIGGDRMASA
ncbi:hypothetical protein [Pararhizobium mangrovi]|uniref:Uncharacterized protein n=1 Tax=Pararhizobium mangrovi TaxID=2590452 RepID=A0A506UH93_9HYPH|nr:hypothetical protein [Pararhizobium mangrovi]TPW32681.1 hypothetical protein FJU11_00175 [Pararhizobium mangrovi]